MRVLLAILAVIVTVPGDGILTADQLRASFTNAQVVDVDPNVTNWGQVAMDQCAGNGSCIVQFRCNQTYTVPALGTWGDARWLETNGEDNIWFRGCGKGSTIISYTDSADDESEVISIEAGSNNVAVTDLSIVSSNTCASDCDGGLSMQIGIHSTATNVLIENNYLESVEAITSDTTNTSVRQVWTIADETTTPDSIPRRVWVQTNDFKTSQRAIEFQWCDHCWAVNNYINFSGSPADTSTPPNLAGIVKYEGIGVILSGNVIKNGLDGRAANTLQNVIGIWLIADFGSVTAAGINRSVVVANNTIEGLRSSAFTGIALSGYNEATITGNHIQAGVCSAASTTSCYVDEDCTSGTCDMVAAQGIVLFTDGVDSTAHNRGNTVVANTFDGLNESGSTVCPIEIQAIVGTDATENTGNLFANNTFRMTTTTDDGFCGDADRIGLNTTIGNHVLDGVVQLDKLCVSIPLAAMGIDIPLGKITTNGYLRNLYCMASTAATAPEYDLEECDASYANCVSATTTNIVCDATNGDNITAFPGAGGASIAAGGTLKLVSRVTGITTGITQVCAYWMGR